MQERSLLDYWVILYERRVVVCLVIVASVVSSFVVDRVMTPTYEAMASFYIPAKVTPVSYLGRGSTATLVREQDSPITKRADYKPYLGILKSVRLAEMVHARYPAESLRKLLRSDMDFEVSDELVVNVYSRDHNPKLAADVANAYVEGLNEILADTSQAQAASEPAFISSALKRINVKLQNAQLALEDFQKKHHLANLDAELLALAAKKAALQDKVDGTIVQISATRAKRWALARELKREGQDFDASEAAITSPLIEYLRKQLADSLTKLSGLEGELGSNNLELMELRQQTQGLQERLNEAIKRWISSRIKPGSSSLGSLREQLINVAIREQELRAQKQANLKSIIRLDRKLRAYPAMKARDAVLKAAVERYRSTQGQLEINLTEARLQSKKRMRLVVQLDHADPPSRPVFPIWWLNLLVALIAGTLAGVGYAFFLNYLDQTRSVRTLRLVQTILGRKKAEAS